MFDPSQEPVEVISYCGLDGSLQPLRFRFKDEEGILRTANILEILDVHNVKHVGAECVRFLCKTEVYDIHHMMELVYTIRPHRWVMTRKLY